MPIPDSPRVLASGVDTIPVTGAEAETVQPEGGLGNSFVSHDSLAIGAIGVALLVLAVAFVGIWKRVGKSRTPYLRVTTVVGLVAAIGVTAVVDDSPAEAFGAETFYGKTSERLLDTQGGSRIAAGSSRTVNAGHGNRAIAVNIVALGATGPGFISVYPCGTSLTGTSVVNYGSGMVVANAIVVRGNASGNLCVRANGSSTHVLVDYTGSVAPGDWVNANSREHNGYRSAGSVLTLSGFTANSGVSLNLTAVSAATLGFFTAYPCNEGRPSLSTGNYAAGQTVGSGYVINADSAGNVCVWTKEAVHLIVDHFGDITAGGGTALTRGVRTLDSRGWVTPSRTNFTLGTPASNAAWHAQVLGVTVIDPTGTGNLKVFPCDTGPYTESTINFEVGQTIGHSVVTIPDDDGQICFRSTHNTKLVVDQFGTLGTTGIMVQFEPGSFTFTGGNGYGLGTTALGFTETVVQGFQPEIDAGYVTSLGSPPPGTTSAPVWLGAHNSTHGAAFGHIDNIRNGAVVRVRWGTTSIARTIQGRYFGVTGGAAPTGDSFFLQTSAPTPNVWLIHN